MPHKDCYEYGNENDDDDADRSRAAAVATLIYYHWAVGHTGVCSFPLRGVWDTTQYSGPVIPSPAKRLRWDERPKAVNPWPAAGIAVCLATAAVAAYLSAARAANFYAREVYGMTPEVHRRYAIASFALAALFAVSYRVPALPVALLLAAAILLATFYFTSFLRGFSDEQ